jgi:dynein heavy chain
VGVGGSGKQSLARLASYILGYDTQGIVVTSNFKLIDLETELQTLFTKCTKPSAGPRCFKITD